MPQIKIEIKEWYPVYVAVPHSDEIVTNGNLTDEDMEDYERVLKEWMDWQRKLKEKYKNRVPRELPTKKTPTVRDYALRQWREVEKQRENELREKNSG